MSKNTQENKNRVLGLNNLTWMLAFVVGLLVVVGTYMVFSASYVGVDNSTPPWMFVLKHLVSMVMGFVAGTVMYFFIARRKGALRFSAALFAVSIAIGALILAYVLGAVQGGSTRWIELPGGFNLQPSELIKLTLIPFVAILLANADPGKSFWGVFIGTSVVGGLVAAENFSSAVLIVLPVVVMLMVHGIKKEHYGFMSILLATGTFGAILMAPYRLKRIIEFVGVWGNPLSADYQSKQSLYALADGGFIGVGLTNSKQKFFHLPEHHTDFIFAIVGEELGFIGAVALIFLLMLVGYLMFRIAVATRDRFMKLTVLGYGILFALQTLLNIAVVTALVPVTGVTLPFISYGGSSMICYIGIMVFVTGRVIFRGRRAHETNR